MEGGLVLTCLKKSLFIFLASFLFLAVSLCAWYVFFVLTGVLGYVFDGGKYGE